MFFQINKISIAISVLCFSSFAFAETSSVESSMNEIKQQLDTMKTTPVKATPANRTCRTGQQATITTGEFGQMINPSQIETIGRFPAVKPGQAKSILWRDPYKDISGDIVGYNESLYIAMRPYSKDSSQNGRVYVALSGESSLTFLDKDNNWKIPPKPLSCQPAIIGNNSVQDGDDLSSQSNELSNNIENMEGLPPELRAKMLSMNNNSSARSNQQRQSSLPVCPENYSPPDTTPQPRQIGSLSDVFHLYIPLGHEASWCPSPGRWSVYVGYGVLTDEIKSEIQKQLAFGENSNKQIEEIIQQRKNNSYGEPTNNYWLNQMEEQLVVYKAQANKIQEQAKSGVTENRLVYQDGYEKQNCWKVFSYQCPTINDDM